MSQPDGLQIMQENMAALEAGSDLPHDESTEYEPDEKPVDNSDEEIEAKVDDEPEEIAEPEVDEVSDIAKKDGFMTKEQWKESGKDPEDYMTPDEFSKVGELRDGDKTRQTLSKQYVQMESAMNELVKGQQQMIEDARKSERDKVVSELKAEKAEAIEYNETEKAIEIDRKIIIEEAKDAPEVKDETPQAPQGMTDWFNSNEHWYSVDQGAANLVNSELSKYEKQGLPFEEGIVKAEAKVKKHFPQYFDDVEEVKTPDEKPAEVKPRPRVASESSRRKPNQSESKRSFSELDPALQKIARKAAKASGLTEAEYMEQS